jgi:signal transduction histidine kinase
MPLRDTRVRLGLTLAAMGLAGAGLWWWTTVRRPPIPKRTLVIGYEHNPPYQIHRPSDSPTGLVIETVGEAARRAGRPFEWKEIPAGPEQALGTGAADLWPLLTDRPERRKILYISAPWLQSQHVLVLRAGRAMPGPDFAEAISMTAVALHVRLLREYFPAAQPVQTPEGPPALAKLCTGEVAAAFLESRLALAVLRDRPSECAALDLRAHMLPGVHALGVGSTFEAAGAADRIRAEISHLANDGTLAVLMARYSFFGLADTRATYDLLEAQERNRRLLWVIVGLAGALAVTLWLAWSLHAARRQRERLMRELEKRHAALERFTYTVSHDLRSPLVTVMGFLGGVEEAALEGRTERVHEDVGRIRAAAERMDRLLHDLLHLSRVGRPAREPEAVPFADLVREARELVAGRLSERGVRLEVDEHLPVVRGDRQRLVEVVENLLDNAAKFMGDQKQPRIEIGVRDDHGQTVFCVRDNGRGIEPRYHEKVFGLFDRLDASVEGTGVGLALVRRIVEDHGGRVWVESEGLGCGSTFCFTLPGAVAARFGERPSHQ